MTASFWNMVAQMSHSLGGLCLVAWTVILFGQDALKISVPIFLLCAGIKELWFDPKFEHPEDPFPDWEDLGFYFLGTGLGLAIYFIKMHIG